MTNRIVGIFILSFGALLFIMSLSTTVNNFISSLILSIPLLNVIIRFIYNVLIAPWWNALILKPLMIIMMIVVSLLLVQVISNLYQKQKIRFSRKIADRKTMAHMVINLEDVAVSENKKKRSK